MTRQLTPRQAERRERILRAVREQIDRAGYDSLSMRSIASEADVSPATLYNLYESKESLVMAAATDLQDHISERFNTSINGADRQAGTLDALLARSEAVGEQAEVLPNLAEAVIKVIFNAAPDSPILQEFLYDDIKLKEQYLSGIQDGGGLRADADLSLLARRLNSGELMLLFQWIKGLIPAGDLPAEQRSHVLATLYPAMTPKFAKRYQSNVQR